MRFKGSFPLVLSLSLCPPGVALLSTADGALMEGKHVFRPREIVGSQGRVYRTNNS